MKQIVQQLDSGVTAIVEAPAPRVTRGTLLIKTTRSLISAGTERMLVGFGKASLLAKARQQPDRVMDVLGKVKTDGLLATVDAVRSKLGQPLPLGYCNVGEVIEVGADVTDFKPGDRVVSNGPHADIVRVPANLCARIPDDVTDEAAAFTVVASIGLQGIRLAEPTIGESFVVTGAGLIGLLTIQLLRAQGCRVLAIDFDESKLELARRYGAETCNPARGEDPVAAGMGFSRGRGVDGVIITASTKSNDPVTHAAQMSRKRGRIILVGVTGLELNRADFYEKELSFQVSCSYGPGRYDPAYEEGGRDYPLAFVRWTEQRNFEAILDLIASGQLRTDDLVTRRFAFEEAETAYGALTADGSGLGFVLEYHAPLADRRTTSTHFASAAGFTTDRPVIAVVGAGNYASRVLIPALKAADAQLHTVVTSGGLSGSIAGRRDGFVVASTDTAEVMANPAIDTMVIATRHDSHAALAAEALSNGKNVFVEKPLALDLAQVEAVESAYAAAAERGPAPQLMVGFNRRFAPQVLRMKALIDRVGEPKSFLMVMNAGAIPAKHWTQDDAIGGGRIIGEACHFVDLMRFLAGAPIVEVAARRIGDTPHLEVTEDKASITLGFADGSFGTIMYLANGAASFPKERIEVFAAGRVLQIDNFRRMTGFGWPGFRKQNLLRQDKGQAACAAAFVDSVKRGTPAIPPAELFEVARATIEAAAILRRQ
ncbi:dehydrogenase [Sphingomonas ginsenosidimutans]|jgi:predicted dehydrogenase/threonine dehydrogenase-like Zn-dependent dehydrogenase|uniref:Dehydrogenase n=1 Tax=Sphingomonas ginsenosidimutans TaxID=862134 RepID=A0A2A4HZJ4_9SPHN|nr:bi-domain-containing oxidoreductase [Sphingomonas ginsenosidimutans]PCG09105.1 dehydrogenase [Sphingomonas ginsenosidimutans]